MLVRLDKLLLAFVLFTLASSAPNDLESGTVHHLVQTENGPIEGLLGTGILGKEVTSYFGIPYAKAPTGENRFKNPLPLLDRSEEVFRATTKPLPCFQNPPLDTLGMLRKYGVATKRPWTEDCLKLNVWVPNSGSEQKAKVMVFIHGGGFYMGSSLAGNTNGAVLAASENVIVVTLNYRLGVFGFLTLGTEDAPGNAGLMDQQMALKWVHNNIEAFGGDPNEITLFGVSSGAASVGFHLLSPGSKGLFKRIIMMSGSPTNIWAIHEKSKIIAKSVEVAKGLGYKGPEDHEKMLQFIRQQEAEDIISSNSFCNLLNGNVLAPTVDGIFIDDLPKNLLRHPSNESRKINVLIGSTSDEGSIFLLVNNNELMTRYADGSISLEEFKGIMRKASPQNIDHWVAEAIVHNYVEMERINDPHMIRDAAKEAIGDFLFNCGIEEFADHLAENGHQVYRYIFDGSPPMPAGMFPRWVGPLHGSDTPIVFGNYLQIAQGDFLKFNQEIMRRYGNFAKTGDPNVDVKEFEENVKWPQYDIKNREILFLRPNGCSIGSHVWVEQCSIIRHLIPLVRKKGTCERQKNHN